MNANAAMTMTMTTRAVQRVTSMPSPVALFDRAATGEREQQLAATLPAFALMARAGLAAARLAVAIAPHASRFIVLAGPGNNGGDGLVAAAHLHAWGRDVRVCLLGDAAALPTDAARALADARGCGVGLIEHPTFAACLADPTMTETQPIDGSGITLWIDALLGIGASRSPAGSMADAIAHLVRARRRGDRVLAIDVPSGLDVDTGQPFGAAVVTADHTLSLLTAKPGLFTASGRDHSGEVWVDELRRDEDFSPTLSSLSSWSTLTPTPSSSPTFTRSNTATAWLTGTGKPAADVARHHAQHKGSFGDVAIVGGTAGMVGAALLAARAALAAGAGRVYLDAFDPLFGIDVTRPELMCRHGWWRDASPALMAATTVVCGCGGGGDVRAALPRLLSLAGSLVLDADALNAIASDAALQAALTARAARRHATVLTPHPLEAARLLGVDTAALQGDRLSAAQALATRFRCIVVLKGSGTVIAAPGVVPSINATGNASLASAGTGDVLAGWIGGHWAPIAADSDADATAAANADESARLAGVVAAVAAHGRASEPLQPGAIRAADLVERLHRMARGKEPGGA